MYRESICNPFFNRGTAFTEDERKKYNLTGMLPTNVRTLNEQLSLEYQKIMSKPTDYQKNLYLMDIYNTNRVLFYRLIIENLEQLLPIVYTPTIADSVMNYSIDFKNPNGAVFLDINHPENISTCLKNASKNLENIDLFVITDGEGVLGIGDWGIGGVMISVGKLAVYTVASGMNPKTVLPIVIDNGTERQELLNDPYYIGNRQHRKTGEQYYSYIDRFIEEALKLFPNVLFHWEDFGRENAETILNRYRNKICTFNDDIQGTGVMMNAAVNAVEHITQIPVENQTYMIFGAGTAGVGIADQIVLEMVSRGVKKEDALKRFYMVDRFGLITDDMKNLTEGQKRYARSKSEFPNPVVDLESAVDIVKPSVLIGTSGQAGKFTENVVKSMSKYNKRPAILPISNPTKLCEAKASDIIRWSNGKALVVTGSPSQPFEYNNTLYTIAQANNALLYPGLGLGIVVSKAKTVTDNMLLAAAHGIASLQNLDKLGCPILPPIKFVRQASKLVATSVVKAAIEDNVNTVEISDIERAVESKIWKTEYTHI